jgi:hypothetical protein
VAVWLDFSKNFFRGPVGIGGVWMKGQAGGTQEGGGTLRSDRECGAPIIRDAITLNLDRWRTRSHVSVLAVARHQRLSDAALVAGKQGEGAAVRPS